MTAEVFVGIDVARDSLEIAMRPTGERWQVGNDSTGIPAVDADQQPEPGETPVGEQKTCKRRLGNLRWHRRRRGGNGRSSW
jgi:hypothetical protein